ncbi:fungal-specific transcription factor domain-containing protein [Hysterangium stoloniferum]|nr:fungal-specific transcription factor domain-containing protein [Hysterangium stoloniferum]
MRHVQAHCQHVHGVILSISISVLAHREADSAVLHETERLKSKIVLLSERVRSLEQGLRDLQEKTVPNIAHPLLSEDLVALAEHSEVVSQRTKAGKEPENGEKDPDDEDAKDLREGLGTMTLHPDGRRRFYGPTATIESLFQGDSSDEEGIDSPEHHTTSSHSSHPIALSPGLPNTGGEYVSSGSGLRPVHSDSPAVLIGQSPHHLFSACLSPEKMLKEVIRLEQCLPEYAPAWKLSEVYYENAAWLHSCVHRNDFITNIFSHIYHPSNTRGSLRGSFSTQKSSPPPTYDLALLEEAAVLFMVFSLGSLMDLSVPPRHPPMLSLAEQYYELAYSALSLSGPCERGSAASIQCLMLMSYYHLLVDKPDATQRSWTLIGVAANLAQCIGLHRESSWWNSDVEDVQRRREVFWELFTYEKLQALTIGLPPSLLKEHIDCELPADPDETVGPDGNIIHGFIYAKRLWAQQIASDTVDLLMTVNKKPTPYSSVLSLDRRIRDDLLMRSKAVFNDDGELRNEQISIVKPPLAMQRIANVLQMETILILIHRKYLARALNGPAANVFTTKYGPSVLASFRSASRVIVFHGIIASLDSDLPLRFWFIWNHLLGAAIVLAALVTRCPTCIISGAALSQLDAGFELFQKAARRGAPRAIKALGVITRLHNKSHEIYDKHAVNLPKGVPDADWKVGNPPINPDIPIEELDLIFGSQRVREVQKRPSLSNSGGIVPSNPAAFGSLFPDLMVDLQSMTQLSQGQAPWNDWSFDISAEATWNDGDINPLPDGTFHPFLPQNFMSNSDVSMDAQNSPTSTTVHAPSNITIPIVPDSTGSFDGAGWDPSWQSILDQLGLAGYQPTQL